MIFNKNTIENRKILFSINLQTFIGFCLSYIKNLIYEIMSINIKIIRITNTIEKAIPI